MNEPGDPGNPLEGLLGDLLKMIGGAPGGASAWFEAARSLAQGVATDGAPEGNVDPLLRIRLEELARVAELHVADATGLALRADAASLGFNPVGRGAYSQLVLESWRPWVERMVRAQEGGSSALDQLGLGQLGASDLGLGDDLAWGAGLQDLLGRFAATMGPVLLGLQFGSAAGHLAQRALGQYALPIPWAKTDGLLFVPENVKAFADDWSLSLEETELWVCVHELTVHAVLRQPHVATRLDELLEASTAEAVALQQGLSERLGGDFSDPEALNALMSDPESLLADLLTPGQQASSGQLSALTTAIGGYVDHITASVAQKLTGSAGALSEAWYRYRTADAKGEQAAGGLFGLDLSRAQVDRGAAFVRGVLERSGEEGLSRLFAAPRNLPTPAEVDAPGLWLERIDLPEEPSGS